MLVVLRNTFKLGNIGKFLGFFAVLALCIVGQAYGADKTVGDIATEVTGSFQGIGKLIIAAAYVAGFSLVLAAIFKFKQHKDNPQQVPMGTPIALLAIGVVLVFLPSLFAPAGQTVFGDEQTAGGFTGAGTENMPGADGGSNSGGTGTTG